MGRRTVLLLVAVILAGLGTAMVFLYVQNADARAAKDQQLQRVLFAKRNVAAGTKVAAAQAAGAFELREVAANSVAPGALSDTTAITNKAALSQIIAGQQIIEGQFGDVGESSALQIPEDKIAVAVQLEDPARVAGFVAPGNEVAVMFTMEEPPQPAPGAAASTQPEGFTRVLLPRVRVIAVGPTTLVPTSTESQEGETATEQVSKALITLAVDQTQAQRIVYAQTKGKLYFALLNDKSKVDAGTATDLENLFG